MHLFLSLPPELMGVHINRGIITADFLLNSNTSFATKTKV